MRIFTSTILLQEIYHTHIHPQEVKNKKTPCTAKLSEFVIVINILLVISGGRLLFDLAIYFIIIWNYILFYLFFNI